MRVRCVSTVVSVLFAAVAAAQSTAFTYQGKLDSGGAPANGLYDLRFRLFNAASGGTQLGNMLCADNVPVTHGLFTTTINFGQQYATNSNLYLEIEVRQDSGVDCSNGSGFTILAPRQPLTAAPLATHSKSAFSLDAPDGTHPDAVLVANNGNVGIGTTTPTRNLHIASAGAPSILLQDTGPDATQMGQLVFSNSLGGENGFLGFTNALNSNFLIQNSRPSGNIVLNANGGGNIGLGTNAPQRTVHIASSSAPVLILQDNGGPTTQTGYIGFWNSNTTSPETGWLGFGYGDGNADFGIVNARSDGDININALGFSSNINIVPGGGGRVFINEFGGNSIFMLNVNGSIRCTTLTQSSSAAFKDDVRPLTAGLDDLLRLEPVSYVWNDKAPEDTRGKHDLGFIAEDVATILPDAVTCDEHGNPIGIDYSRITVLAVKAIKEQQAHIERLEALLSEALRK